MKFQTKPSSKSYHDGAGSRLIFHYVPFLMANGSEISSGPSTLTDVFLLQICNAIAFFSLTQAVEWNKKCGTSPGPAAAVAAAAAPETSASASGCGRRAARRTRPSVSRVRRRATSGAASAPNTSTGEPFVAAIPCVSH